jgi:glycine cleavage system transcriptional repressor
MTRHVVLTTIGDDRPGLVDEVSRFVFERGGNIEDSRMVNLHGQFTIMMLVAGDDTTMGRLQDGLGILNRESRLHAELHPADFEARAGAAEALPYRLSASAIDQPGLVQPLAHLLAELGVNIESAQTTLAEAPITGAPVFSMELVISVPRATPIGALRAALAQLCDTLNLDWQLAAL